MCLYRISKLWPVLLFCFTPIFNEFLIYYFKIALVCKWPEVDSKSEHIKAFMIADTHLLGIYRGHWFDKLKREWQMRQAFRSAIAIHAPDVIFFLGDLFDEGKWANEELFEQYTQEFKKLFETDVPIYVLAGNHDIGFHYEFHPYIVNWFNNSFNRSLVDAITIKGTAFVFVNSMAFHGDNCALCRKAELELKAVSKRLQCAKYSNCTEATDNIAYKRPILLLHFPLYRVNESDCLRDKDFDYSVNRDEKYRPRWESLSREATKELITSLEPRAVFNGHSHKGCKKRWIRPSDFWEYTVNSFSWRNGDRPTFLMTAISDTQVNVSTCFLPNESTTFIIYIISSLIFIGWLLSRVYHYFPKRKLPRDTPHPLLDYKDGSKYD